MTLLTCNNRPLPAGYAVPEKALRRWAAERVRREDLAHGRTAWSFRLSGSTCNNVPIEVTMTVEIGEDGRIVRAEITPNDGADNGCAAMCAARGDAERFFATIGPCQEAVGLTLEQAAFRDWQESASGCLCTAANRRHKWRNAFQALHYAFWSARD